jgi:transcriptional regulator with XRE-family HTH domain
MGSKKVILLPRIEEILNEVGANIKLARLRRRFSAELIAARAGISRPTLRSIENGSSSVAFGAYAQVLFVLGFEEDLLKLADDDVLGRKLQDIGLVVKKRSPKRKRPAESPQQGTSDL